MPLAVALVGPLTSEAFAATGSPATPTSESSAADEARLKALSEELRCLVCQNQTLADSNAELAVDLRNQVKALIAEGRSDEQIKRYLVDRYGQFVLYKPQFQPSTWLLWGGPFVLLIGGLLIWWRLGRRPSPTSRATASPQAPASAASGASTAPADPSIAAGRRLLDDDR